jgi:hypothetical protein
MRKIKIMEHITLDGVIQARRPGRRWRLPLWRMGGAACRP